MSDRTTGLESKMPKRDDRREDAAAGRRIVPVRAVAPGAPAADAADARAAQVFPDTEVVLDADVLSEADVMHAELNFAEVPERLASVAERAARPKARRIGEYLRQVRELGVDKRTKILNYQARHRIPFGEAAIKLGYVSREDVVWALSKQYEYSYLDEAAELPINDELVMARRPFGDSVECFRSLRTHLSIGLLSQKRTPIAIVSPNIGDGKTFILSNLAVAFSQLRQRTVIIDADLRSPRAHKIFGIRSSEGLSSVLSGRSRVRLYSFSRALPNLFVLPAGAVPPNPTELLHSREFDLLLDEMMREYDVVLVDTPAAAHGSDARVVAEKCGAALMVVKRNQSRLRDAKAFADQLRLDSCAIIGPLVNE